MTCKRDLAASAAVDLLDLAAVGVAHGNRSQRRIGDLDRLGVLVVLEVDPATALVDHALDPAVGVVEQAHALFLGVLGESQVALVVVLELGPATSFAFDLGGALDVGDFADFRDRS